ncbi:MAG: Pectate lyase superfamily protein [Bacteriophage sp.]|nr:MAG: Pectate lyase superfamily protein [Bacteriophage sp.]
MNKFEYKNLTPFKWFVLENFPFIEADFDALTEWQLFCKLGKEMNKIINSENTLGSQMENVTNAFIELQNYVNNYFDSLDVQEEINNKLNEMVADGTLENIISNYVNENIIKTFDTYNDFINDTSLVNGMTCRTLGFYEINDSGGALYKITNVQPTNNSYYISLNNNLFAYIINTNNYFSIKQLGAKENDPSFDNALLFNNAFKINKNILIPNGLYYVDTDITIPSDITLKWDENATIIKKPTNKELYRMFDIFRVKNVTFINPKIIGDKNTHLGTSGEYGYPIYIAESQNVKIYNADISQAWGDGIYIGLKYMSNPVQNTDNIIIENFYIHNISRNGITIGTGKNITIKNGRISKVNRTSPKAGIDIEIENDELPNLYLSNINISNVEINDTYLGITMNLNKLTGININSINIENIKFNSSEYGIAYYNGNPEGTLNIDNIKFNNYKTPFYFVNKGENLKTNINNIDINNKIEASTDDHFNSIFTITVDENYSNGNININNVNINNYLNLKRFLSIMRKTAGTTTSINNIKINKCNTENIINYILVTNINNIIIENSDLKYISDTQKETSQYNFVNNLIFNNITAFTQNNISSVIPDGLYKVKLLKSNNNTLRINFIGLNISGLTTETQINFTSDGCTLEFYKNGNDVIITNLTKQT